MKKIFLALGVFLCGLAFMVNAPSALALDCSIVDTGPNSTNNCTSTQTNDFTVTCTNNTVVSINNNQIANTGNVTINSNTNSSSGFSYSGNAVNKNQTTGKLDISCVPAVALIPPPAPAPTPAPSPTPVAAQATPAGGQGQAAPKAKALPNTGSNDLMNSAIAVVAGMGVVGVSARLALSAYRRFALR